MISFQSKGLIDPRCITTIGVSVKETDNPIGFFGTGLKYAIAIILREKGSISIFRGEEELKFSFKTATIRGKNVDIVCMNGVELGFTTDLGKQWKVWQAFREIYCNTLDEKGACTHGPNVCYPGATTVRVDLPAFDECYRERNKYFISGQPLYSTKYADFHEGGYAGMYYRGVRIGDELGTKPMRFRMNIKETISLTEDRTAASSYDIWKHIADAILESDDEAFIENWLTSGPDYQENQLDLSWLSTNPSDAFMKVASRLMRDTSRPINLTTFKVVTRFKQMPEPISCVLMKSEQADLDKAIAFCKKLGYEVNEFPITVVESLGENVLGMAIKGSRRVLIARRCISMGDRTLIGTLIEEWVHIKHGYHDCHRDMQNWLFDNLVRLGKAYVAEVE